jgi:hypothetical protein
MVQLGQILDVLTGSSDGRCRIRAPVYKNCCWTFRSPSSIRGRRRRRRRPRPSSRRQTKIKQFLFLLAPMGGEENVAASLRFRAVAKPYSLACFLPRGTAAYAPTTHGQPARTHASPDASREVRSRRAVRYQVSCHQLRLAHRAIPPVTSPFARHTFLLGVGAGGKSEGQGSKGRGTPIRSPSRATRTSRLSPCGPPAGSASRCPARTLPRGKVVGVLTCPPHTHGPTAAATSSGSDRARSPGRCTALLGRAYFLPSGGTSKLPRSTPYAWWWWSLFKCSPFFARLI